MTVTYSVVWGPQWGFAPPDNIHHAAPQCPTPPTNLQLHLFGIFRILDILIAFTKKLQVVSNPYPGQALHAMQMENRKMKIGLRWLGLVIKDNCSDSESTL